jgi:hypothetical protein
MKNLVFKEVQKFHQFWIWALLTIVIGLWAWGIYVQIILGQPWGSKPASDSVLIALSIIPVIIFVLFLIMRLETEITNEGVYFQFFPFHLKKRFIDWHDVSKAYVREYKPVKEYGGWGLRKGLKSGVAYNVSGNIGLQLEMKDSSRILIGTSHAKDLENFIRQMNEAK